MRSIVGMDVDKSCFVYWWVETPVSNCSQPSLKSRELLTVSSDIFRRVPGVMQISERKLDAKLYEDSLSSQVKYVKNKKQS